MMLSGDTMDVQDEYGEPIHDETFLMLFNAHHESMSFVLPGQEDVRWELILATEVETGFLEKPELVSAGDDIVIVERSMRLFRLSVGSETHARSDSWKKAGTKTAPTPRKRPARTRKSARESN